MSFRKDMSSSNHIPGFFFKKLTVSYLLTNFPRGATLWFVLLVCVAACHTKILFAMGLGRSGKVLVGAINVKKNMLCFLLSCSVFPFVFVFLCTCECCFSVVVVFCCSFCCAVSAVYVCLLLLLFGCVCVWA